MRSEATLAGRGATSWAPWTAFRSCTRTASRRPACARPRAPRSSPATCPRRIRWSPPGRAPAAPCCWARRTCRSSAQARRPSTLCSARRATRTTPPAPPAARAAGLPPRWRAAWRRWRTAATWAGRSATRRASAASPACGPRPAACRAGRPPIPGTRSASTGRSAARWRTSPCCSPPPPAPTPPAPPSRPSARAGPAPRVPLSPAGPGPAFACIRPAVTGGLRIAYSPALGGLPVEPAVSAVTAAAAELLAGLGCAVIEAEPDLSGADAAFETLRAIAFERDLGTLLDEHPAELKDTVRWNIEQGRRLTGADVARAQALRGALHDRWQRFLERHDFLVTIISQVAPFAVEQEWVAQIEGHEMGSYIEWMRS